MVDRRGFIKALGGITAALATGSVAAKTTAVRPQEPLVIEDPPMDGIYICTPKPVTGVVVRVGTDNGIAVRYFDYGSGKWRDI